MPEQTKLSSHNRDESSSNSGYKPNRERQDNDYKLRDKKDSSSSYTPRERKDNIYTPRERRDNNYKSRERKDHNYKSREKYNQHDYQRKRGRSPEREDDIESNKRQRTQRGARATVRGLANGTQPAMTTEKQLLQQGDAQQQDDAMAALGLPVGFSSSKGTKVADKSANMSGAHVVKKRRYKQYLNRTRRGEQQQHQQQHHRS